MRIFVTGSIAYDYIMVFPGRFRDHILPDKMHVLSVSFLVDSLTRLRGGTGANICVQSGAPGGAAAPGGDASAKTSPSIAPGWRRTAWIAGPSRSSPASTRPRASSTPTCRTTRSRRSTRVRWLMPSSISLAEAGRDSDDLVLIAPNDPAAMNRYADRMHRTRAFPIFTTRRCSCPRLERADLEKGCRGARILAGNDYEFGMMAEKLGVSEAELRRLAPVTVMTRGEAGALITVGTRGVRHPARQAQGGRRPDRGRRRVPRGLHPGIEARLALAGGRPAGRPDGRLRDRAPGPQQHSYTLDEFLARYRENFGSAPELDVAGRLSPERLRVSACRNDRRVILSRQDDATGTIARSSDRCIMSRRKWIAWCARPADVGAELASAVELTQGMRPDRQPGRRDRWKIWSSSYGDDQGRRWARLRPGSRPTSGSPPAGKGPLRLEFKQKGNPLTGFPGRGLRPGRESPATASSWCWSSRTTRSSGSWRTTMPQAAKNLVEIESADWFEA